MPPQVLADPTHPDAVYDAQRVVQIDGEGLEQEFLAVSAHTAFWGARHAEATRTHLLARARLKAIEAAAELRFRAHGLPDSAVKMTEGSVAAYVATAKEVQDAQLASIEAEAEKARLWALVEALRVKKDMLVTIGATRRAELGSNPLIRNS